MQKIQIDYDALATIAQHIDREGQDVETLVQRIRGLIEELERGGWTGQGARAFYDEMYQVVLPGLRALYDALYDTCDATRAISDIMRRAEEDAANQLK